MDHDLELKRLDMLLGTLSFENEIKRQQELQQRQLAGLTKKRTFWHIPTHPQPSRWGVVQPQSIKIGQIWANSPRQKETRNGGPRCRRCIKCDKIAVKGYDVCSSHGARDLGRRVQFRIARGQLHRASHAVATRLISRALSQGLVPEELTREPVFTHLLRIAMPWRFKLHRSVIEAEGYTTYDMQRARLFVRDLMITFAQMRKGNPKPWADTIQRIYEAGLAPRGKNQTGL